MLNTSEKMVKSKVMDRKSVSSLECEAYQIPSHELTNEQVEAASFLAYGLLLRVTEIAVFTNVADVEAHLNVDLWDKQDHQQLNYLADSILSRFFEFSENESFGALDVPLAELFAKDILSTMPREGGRIPFDEIKKWVAFYRGCTLVE